MSDEPQQLDDVSVDPHQTTAPAPPPSGLHVAEWNLQQVSRRNHGRLKIESLYTNFGPILDLSVGGMRVVASRRPKGDVMACVVSNGMYSVQVRGRVAWAKRLGFFKHLLGISFVDVTDEQKRQLTALGSQGAARRCLAS